MVGSSALSSTQMDAAWASLDSTSGAKAIVGEWRIADRVLQAAERASALLARCKPQNESQALAQALQTWKSGQPRAPAFIYAAAPNLTRTRQHLSELLEILPSDVISGLYVARVLELDLECRMAGIVLKMGNRAAGHFSSPDRFAAS